MYRGTIEFDEPLRKTRKDAGTGKGKAARIRQWRDRNREHVRAYEREYKPKGRAKTAREKRESRLGN